MNDEFKVVNVDAQHIRDAHFDAIDQLVSSSDANHACVSILRLIADLSGSTSAFICIDSPEGHSNNLEIFSSASTGPFFKRVNSKQKAIEVLADFGWINLHEPFTRILPNTESFQNQTFAGYPLFDQLGRLTGSFSIIVNSPNSLQILHENFSMVLSLLIHRVQEFHFLESPLIEKPINEVLQISRRGVHFPSLSETYSQSAHTINGQLAVASLQSQILSSTEIADSAVNLGLERISKAIAQTGLLLQLQEDAIMLLVDRSSKSIISSSISMAKESFSNKMSKKTPAVLHMNIPDRTLSNIPGNIAFWMFHNLFRMVAAIYQWLPGPDTAIEFYATTVNDPSTNQACIDLQVHFPFNSDILELSNEILSKDPRYLSGEALPNIASILFKIFSMCDISWMLDITDTEIIIKLVVPTSEEDNLYAK